MREQQLKESPHELKRFAKSKADNPDSI